MFNLNETVLVSDPVEALSEEDGCFQTTARSGETIQIRLEAGYMTIEHATRSLERTRRDLLWEVVKVK
jgi:hypothetical protein